MYRTASQVQEVIPLQIPAKKFAPKKTLVAMSGGVDSSAAAALLLEQGHACGGVTLKLLADGDPAAPQAAQAVAERLGIPFHIFEFSEAFGRAVLRPFAESYLRGETPNPCVDCNKHIKFPAVLARAQALNYDSIATGHYVRREFAGGRFLLRRAVDHNKDQSYFLYALTQAQLARTQFPLGGMTKTQVRALAEAHGFVNAKQRDSQDICFIPGGDYGAFLERYLGYALPPGDFVDISGNVLGTHRGTPRYTLGQRKGLGLALPQPGYVVEICSEKNMVVVGEEAALFSREVLAKNVNFIAMESLQQPVRCLAKIRYRQKEQPATAEQIDADTIRVVFDEPQRAITPGQAVVLYDGEYVIGGGTIAKG